MPVRHTYIYQAGDRVCSAQISEEEEYRGRQYLQRQHEVKESNRMEGTQGLTIFAMPGPHGAKRS